MNTEPELLNERLERLAIALDEIMPRCALLVRDAVSLLKDQEAVEPDVDSEGTCTCGNCGETVGYYPAGSKVPVKLCKYCPECGQAVKWE